MTNREISNTEVFASRNGRVKADVSSHGCNDHSRLVGLVGIVSLPSFIEFRRYGLQFLCGWPDSGTSVDTAVLRAAQQIACD